MLRGPISFVVLLLACASLPFAGACAEDEDAAVVGADQIVTLAAGDVFTPAAGFSVGDHGFQTFGVGSRSERIVSARSDRPWTFDHVETLPWELASSATGAIASGVPSLYFVAPAAGRVSLQVARLEDGRIGPATPVVVDGQTRPPFWPQTVGLRDGRVLLAFVVPQTSVFVGTDDGTGARFRVKALDLPQPDLRGVLAHPGITPSGAWVVTYQVADPQWRFHSFAVLSRDEGATWSTSAPIEIARGDDVSDAFPIARLDRGADLYYVLTETVDLSFGRTKTQRTVRRRALFDDGSLGPEQTVTSASLPPVAMPQPRRLRDGRLALMLTVKPGDQERDLVLAILDGDAPL